MPADVFRALDEVELGFMRERVEAEFASSSLPSLPFMKIRGFLGVLLYFEIK